MSQRGWVGWVAANRVTSAGVAIASVVALLGIGIVASRSDDDETTDSLAVDTGQVESTAPGSDGSVATTPGDPTVTTPGAPAPDTGGGGGGGEAAPSRPLPGRTTPPPPCSPKDVDETGISKDEVVIGQIVSDVSVLPAQLYPVHEGVQAYINLVNANGGVCGRKIRIEYSNDGSNPATHDYEAMARQVFAFVGNASLIDQLDYGDDAPFEPRFKDGDQFVPDIGGLAFSYNRSQSDWHAGSFGSVSPSLVGGGQYRYMIEKSAAEGRPCREAGVVYLREPNGASEDQGRLGGAALAADWGGNFGSDKVHYYVANLGDPVVVYQQMAAQMVADNVNCVFTYSDLGSNVNLVQGMANQGVWPYDKCSGTQCIVLVSMPFAAYDPKFIRDAGDASRLVNTYIPHIPLNETGSPAMQQYINALKTVRGAEPSTFGIIGYVAAQMFATSLEACGAAPTRNCVMEAARSIKDFDAGGLIGPITPFRRTKVNCSDGCGNFRGRGTYNFKHIFVCATTMQVLDRDGRRDFYRINPAQGYACDTLRVVRGKPA